MLCGEFVGGVHMVPWDDHPTVLRTGHPGRDGPAASVVRLEGPSVGDFVVDEYRTQVRVMRSIFASLFAHLDARKRSCMDAKCPKLSRLNGCKPNALRNS